MFNNKGSGFVACDLYRQPAIIWHALMTYLATDLTYHIFWLDGFSSDLYRLIVMLNIPITGVFIHKRNRGYIYGITNLRYKIQVWPTRKLSAMLLIFNHAITVRLLA